MPKTYNDFYTDISNPSSDYIYFNISDLNDNLNQPIYYCKTDKNPEYYQPTSNCSLVILNYYDKKDSNGKYEYYYTVDTCSRIKGGRGVPPPWGGGDHFLRNGGSPPFHMKRR